MIFALSSDSGRITAHSEIDPATGRQSVSGLPTTQELALFVQISQEVQGKFLRNGLYSPNCSATSRGGNASGSSEAFGRVGVKRVDFNRRLVKRESLLAICCVFRCF